MVGSHDFYNLGFSYSQDSIPKIKNEKVLPASERKRWQQFSSFLKAHEETHRQIWLDCAADLERRVKSIKAKSCSDADRKATLLWDKIRTACNKKHVAFDAAEQKRLLAPPSCRWSTSAPPRSMARGWTEAS